MSLAGLPGASRSFGASLVLQSSLTAFCACAADDSHNFYTNTPGVTTTTSVPEENESSSEYSSSSSSSSSTPSGSDNENSSDESSAGDSDREELNESDALWGKMGQESGAGAAEGRGTKEKRVPVLSKEERTVLKSKLMSELASLKQKK